MPSFLPAGRYKSSKLEFLPKLRLVTALNRLKARVSKASKCLLVDPNVVIDIHHFCLLPTILDFPSILTGLGRDTQPFIHETSKSLVALAGLWFLELHIKYYLCT